VVCPGAALWGPLDDFERHRASAAADTSRCCPSMNADWAWASGGWGMRVK
jgi:hypothetical protein